MSQSPQREELMQWFLEHGQELIPHVGGVLIPSGGTPGQVLAVDDSGGVEWVDADSPAFAVDALFQRSVNDATWYQANTPTKPNLVVLLAELQMNANSSAEGNASVNINATATYATKTTLGTFRVRHDDTIATKVVETMVFVLPIGWRYFVETVGAFGSKTFSSCEFPLGG